MTPPNAADIAEERMAAVSLAACVRPNPRSAIRIATSGSAGRGGSRNKVFFNVPDLANMLELPENTFGIIDHYHDGARLSRKLSDLCVPLLPQKSARSAEGR